MPKTERIPTPTEKRIEELIFARSPSFVGYDKFVSDLKKLCDHAILFGIDAEVIALAVMANACALVAAQKMVHQIRPEFADALAEDFRASVIQQTFPGIPAFIKPPGAKRG